MTLAAPLPAAAQGLVDATNLDGILAIAKDYGDAVSKRISPATRWSRHHRPDPVRGVLLWLH
ncbi:MAG: hypothetical protein R3D59_13815 [Paracoccaceae bacterium]